MISHLFILSLTIWFGSIIAVPVFFDTWNQRPAKAVLIVNFMTTSILTGCLAYFWATAWCPGEAFVAGICGPVPGLLFLVNYVAYRKVFQGIGKPEETEKKGEVK